MEANFAIEQLGNDCIRVLSGKLTKHMLGAYESTADPTIFCRKQIRFVWQQDGTVKFASPPAKVPLNYKATNDPRVFAPDFPDCPHRRMDVTVKKSCQCVSVIWHCIRHKSLPAVPDCRLCISEGRNKDEESVPDLVSIGSNYSRSVTTSSQ